MAKKKASRLGEAIRKRALSYPETHEDLKTSMALLHFLIDEGFRAVAPKKMVAALPEPPRLPS